MNIYSLNFFSLTNLVKGINYGFIDKDGEFHNNTFTNPDNNYFLQNPNQTLTNNIGLCFDIVEIYRAYLHHRGLYCESYYLEYSCGDILETHAFIIHRKKNNLWYECVDNSWNDDFSPRGYHDKEYLIKEVYEWFQDYVIKLYGDVDKTKFYLNKYLYPKPVYLKQTSLIEYCKRREYLGSYRAEFSGMAIVFHENKVLVLETKHNEMVFPKGHIENGENSKEASIRECLEESGVNLSKATYLGDCGKYSYTFSSGHLKVTNDSFYRTFGVSQITKTVYVHVYLLKNIQKFTLENIFINGYWIDIDKVSDVITHENTIEVFNNALVLLDKFNKNKMVM